MAGVAASIASRHADTAFLSEAWFRASVDTWMGAAKFRLLEFVRADALPAWALLGQHTEVRHGLLPVRVLALNESGLAALDQPWIELNGFFGQSPGSFNETLDALLDHLLEEPNWDELRLAGLEHAQAREAMALAARAGLVCAVRFDQPSFQVDLDEVRARFGGVYLDALSANTRQQLRRSRRLIERALGELSLDQAGSVEEALAWFAQTGPLHRARWASEDAPPFSSGFDNPAFVAFHRSVISHGFPAGQIEYLRLRAGTTTLAYLYNLVASGRVQFYLSGIDFSAHPQARPGMLAHWLAIERALQAGHNVYDFLAGDARYKRSLSTRQDRTLWLVLQRPRLRLRFESWARELKQAWRDRSSAGERGPPRLLRVGDANDLTPTRDPD